MESSGCEGRSTTRSPPRPTSGHPRMGARSRSLFLSSMPKLRAHNIAMSVDGYMAGPDQSLEDPLGIGGNRLHEWVFVTRTGAAMTGAGGGETGVDDDHLAAGFEGIGAWILGRKMFGPVRGPWPDASWNGWWGPN